MKKLLLILFFPLIIHAQPTSSFWLQYSGGSGNDEALDIAEKDGFTYATGYFSEYTQIGSFQIAPLGGGDIFVSKQAPDGSYLWAKRFGGNQADRGIAIDVMPNGNVVFGGIISGSVQFDNITLSTQNAGQDVFVCCLSPDGDVIWAQLFGNGSVDIISDLKVNALNEVVVSSQFKGSIQIGTQNYQSKINPTNQQASYDLLLFKLSQSGQVVWSKHGKTSKDDRSLNLSIDEENNIYYTGIFSDTLQFVSVYTNITFNMGFLMKFSNSGDELWFRKVQSSVTTISGVSASAGKVYIAGDFFGTQRFANSTNATSWQTLTNSNPSKYYISCYNYAGDFIWAKANGSENSVNCKGVIAFANGSAAIAGEFKCQHTDLSNNYGSGLYLSRGESDIYMSSYSANGTLQWAKQIGGIGIDEVNSVNKSSVGLPILAGSFDSNIAAPATPDWFQGDWYNFLGSVNNTSYCNDIHYDFYATLISKGNKDALLANVADANRSTLDIFKREQLIDSCNFDVISGQINAANPDTFCGDANLTIVLPTNPVNVSGIEYQYLWNNESTGSSLSINSTQTNSVIVKAQNNCFQFSDTTSTFIIEPAPEAFISTNYGQILNSLPELSCINKMVIVQGDTAILNGNAVASPFISFWTLPNGIQIPGSTISVTELGNYVYSITRNDGSCGNSACLQLFVFNSQQICEGSGEGHVFKPLVLFNGLPLDTIAGCPLTDFNLQLVDSSFYYSNVATNINLFAHWKTIGPFAIAPYPSGATYTLGVHSNNFIINGTGNAQIRINLMNPPGNTDSILSIVKDFYIIEYPNPIINFTLSGNYIQVCPGDTPTVFIQSNAQISLPTNTINQFSNPDGFQTLVPDNYDIGLLLIDSVTGCFSDNIVQVAVDYKSTPEINMLPDDGIICPDDSVTLSTLASLQIAWIGPTGDSISTQQVAKVNAPGLYYALVTDLTGCTMISNTVNVRQFTTPNYSVQPQRICTGEPALIAVDLLEGDSIEWLPPLTGNLFEQTVYEPGAYSFKFYKCGIITEVTVNVESSAVLAEIGFESDSILCEGSSLKLIAIGGSFNYEWLPSGNYENFTIVELPGEYILEATDEFGCKARDTVTLNQIPAPAQPAKPNAINLCVGEPVTVNSPNNDVVMWFINDSLITQTPVNSVLLGINQANDSVYVVRVDSITGCFSAKILYPISIKPPLQLDSLSDMFICLGTDTLVSFNSNWVGVESFNWIDVNGFSSSDSVLNFSIFNNNMAGTYNFIAIADSAFCGSDTLQFNLVALSLPLSISVTFPINACSGNLWQANVQTNIGDTTTWLWNNQTIMTDTLSFLLDSIVGNSFNISWTITNQAGCSSSYESDFNVTTTPVQPLATFPDKVCEGDTILIPINLINQNADYLQFGSNIPFELINSQLVINNVTASNNNELYLYMENNGCFSDTVFYNFNVGVNPIIEFPDTVFFCFDDEVIIEDPTQFADNYLWGNGSVNSTTVVNQQGWYTLLATTNAGCETLDSVFVRALKCIVNPAPNVFTPNDDGYNDLFKLYANGMTIISMRIFNRWGQLVYETKTVNEGWDGFQLNGTLAPDGTYFYVANAKYLNDNTQEIKGSVTLIR